MLKIYNSLGRIKQEFVPLRPGEVRMYVCGMTVYDYLHLGHARMLIAFDVVQRWLRASGYRVTYVRNITDIDDKIIRRALENRESIGELTARFIRCIDEDAAALGVQKPDHEPRATQFVPQMVDMIGRLEEKKLAYRSASGDVNFAVRRFPGYGKLSGKSIDELRAGERVEVDASKEDPLDFVLWKRSKPDEPRWPSRYGEGRPGWHIECSAMGRALLGEHFDIHGAARTCSSRTTRTRSRSPRARAASSSSITGCTTGSCASTRKRCRSRSQLLHRARVLQRFDPEVVRFFILRAHYRSALGYSDKHLEDAKQALTRLYTALKIPAVLPSTGTHRTLADSGGDGRRLRHTRGGGGAVRARARDRPRPQGAGAPAEGARRRPGAAAARRRRVPARRRGRGLDCRAHRRARDGEEA